MSTPPTPVPPPAPERRSNVLWWILGVVAVGVLLVGLGGLFLASFVLREIRVDQSAGRVQVSTPAGEIRVSQEAKVDPGLPVYPGATATEKGGTVELSGPSEEQVSITAVRYRTTHKIELVDAWYQEQLGPTFKREGPGIMLRKREVLGVSVKSSDIAYIAEEKDLLRVVVIEKKGNFTEIALARIGKQESQ